MALLIAYGSTRVEASGDGIQVVDITNKIDFPGDIGFTLTAEGEEEIVEVELRYRPVNSDVWSYVYPNLEPGHRVTTRVALNAVGPGYLPPGAEIEFYYLIRDSAGNVHETEPEVVEYTDNRFDWESTQIGPLTLLHHDLSSSRVTAVAESVGPQLEVLAELLQITSSQPIKGVIYNRFREVGDAFPNQSRTTTEQQVFQGFAFSPYGVFIGLGLQPRLIIHESAHLMLDQALGPDAAAIPAWLNEGFASFAEPGSSAYSASSLRSRSQPLLAMNSVSGTPQDISNFYLKAESVVSFMLDEYGIENFQRLLNRISQGTSVNSSMEEVYGFGIAGLDAHWANRAEGPAAPPSGAPRTQPPIVYFSTWIIGGLALVVAASVVIRSINRKLRPEPADDPEEGLQPWEDPDLLDDYDDGPPD